jgi:glycosyltransferase involved in cell wall biosynthesis
VSPPRFSVLLSAHNEERLVGEAIRSVLRQTLADFELIVVDDGSADATAEVVGGFLEDPRVRLIEQENRGLAPSLNTAAAAGSAPRLALIDADDLWFPQFLERMAVALDATPDAGFAYTDAWWFQEASGRFFRQSVSEYIGAPARPLEDPDEMLLSLLPGNWVFGLTAIERDAFEQVGGFDESLAACEDYELWLRLLAAGYRAPRAPGRLAVQRDRGASMSSDRTTMLKSLKAVYRIVAEQLEVSDRVRVRANEMMAEMDRSIAADGGRGSLLSLGWWARSSLGTLRKRVAPGSVWHEGVPVEVGDALTGFDFSARPGPG